MGFWTTNRNNRTLQFSDAASFRLCTEGLRALERYETSAVEKDLQLAEESLAKCVLEFPSDVLPKFYLGTVKTLKGYPGLAEAKELFSDVMREGDASLAFAAKYNLAIANVEQYTDESFAKAQTLLDDLVQRKPKEPSKRKTYWSARATSLYIRAHELWKKREGIASERDLSSASIMLQNLDAFLAEFKSSGLTSERDALSDYWNTRGAIYEYLAFVSKTKAEQSVAADLAKIAYQHAVDQKVDYVNSYSNLARLEGDVFHNNVEARRMWESLLPLGKSKNYIHYNLGKISERDGKRDEAIGYYADAAPEIPEAAAALIRLTGSNAVA